jgi:hypothetical protein
VARPAYKIHIATSVLERGGLIGIGGAVHDTLGIGLGRELVTFSTTLGTSIEQNIFNAELTAIASALDQLPQTLLRRHIIISTSNLSAIKAIGQPKQQLGQLYISAIYSAIRNLRMGGNSLAIT